MSPEQLARAYVATVNGAPNGWGQYVHPTLGNSHHIMQRLSREAGAAECERLITEAFKRRA